MRLTSSCHSGREGLSHRDCERGMGSAAGPQRLRGRDRLWALPACLGRGTDWGCSSIPRCPHSFLGDMGRARETRAKPAPCVLSQVLCSWLSTGDLGGEGWAVGERWSPRSPEDEQAGRGLSTSHTSVLGEAIWRRSVMVEAGMMPTGAVAAPWPKQLPLAPKY